MRAIVWVKGRCWRTRPCLVRLTRHRSKPCDATHALSGVFPRPQQRYLSLAEAEAGQPTAELGTLRRELFGSPRLGSRATVGLLLTYVAGLRREAGDLVLRHADP